jgi:hypothetical protein
LILDSNFDIRQKSRHAAASKWMKESGSLNRCNKTNKKTRDGMVNGTLTLWIARLPSSSTVHLQDIVESL